MRRRGLKGAAIAAFVVSAGIAGCSCEVSVGDEEPPTSDGPAVEAVIASGLAEQSGVPPASVSCPEELVQEEGRRYECIAVHPTKGENIVDVTMHDDQGFKWLVR